MSTARLYVVVPGIGGSVLERPGGVPLWGRVGTTASAVLHPAGLEMAQEVVPVGLMPSTSVCSWTLVPGYDRLVQGLMNSLRLGPADVDVARPDRAPSPEASVLLFPYDFRQSMAVNAERLRLEVDRRAAGRRVVVVAHSMGGLVAQWWWAVLGGHAVCDRLVTVGTPHRGAPKALDWLLNGIRLGPSPIAEGTSRLLGAASGVLAQWDSTWELLPRYPAVLEGGVARYPHQVSVAPESFRRRAEAAYQRHLLLEKHHAAVLRSDASLRRRTMVFYSSGHATPGRAVVDGSRVRVERGDAEWLPGKGWEGGDGTVPAIAVTPVEDGQQADEPLVDGRTWSPDTHMRIASTPGLVEYVTRFDAASLAAVRGEPNPAVPWVAFDQDEVWAVGEHVEIRATLRGADPSGVRARFRLFPEHGGPAELDVRRDGQTWASVVLGAPAGVHRVRVELDHVPGVDRVVGETQFGVVPL
ncbi:lecithin:cholesterol acyltransferase [Saccharothrix carnea]|uniref:Lecithin:cholesterol acyltransferase n=1 Tax=Saccharothrix carnea TaxID=1280637 RepID=A0A2P8IEY9_SACCR|nr:hypothetical protein [Saccharothrix carnea]PSL57022.1 lecithin:cholesterol acyltransferase [Saccharothrix carnea]